MRGHGWKKEEGIGKTNKKVVPLRVLEMRPKGLGLGVQFPGNPLEKKQKNGLFIICCYIKLFYLIYENSMNLDLEIIFLIFFKYQ